MFEPIFESTGRTRKPWTVTAGFLVQMMAVGGSILIPMVYTDALPRARFVGWYSPPPRGRTGTQDVKRAPVRTQAHTGHRVFSGTLVQPAAIPTKIAILNDPPLAPEPQEGGFGVQGGIGLPGDDSPQAGLMTRLVTLPPPPDTPAVRAPVRATPKPAETPAEPIRVLYSLQEAKLLHKVTPAYPPLAKQARITGMVRLDATIGKDGRIEHLRVLSGHPLLIPATVEAIEQWVYRPTLLNGQPVEVVTMIDVHFTLTP